MAANQPSFSLTPYTANQNIINHSTREGQKLYSKATQNFMGDELFDVRSAGLAG
eukprot:CAMPEP_0194257266 /NCGR_PEP_ID=MMETSP0158-20130606/38594_1 /TAXON_ID=33649 /ORGANISM="Thalassionema nitzschioides, Strain L26-B" /LENGTH=53 /DNA_ID=CAMNT_0038996249 /DNA_START=7 /DNA_END=164 /DNA_ORIENTATION=-